MVVGGRFVTRDTAIKELAGVIALYRMFQHTHQDGHIVLKWSNSCKDSCCIRLNLRRLLHNRKFCVQFREIVPVCHDRSLKPTHLAENGIYVYMYLHACDVYVSVQC